MTTMHPGRAGTREARLRRRAARRGLRIEKSRERDPLIWTYGTYQLVDRQDGWLVASGVRGNGYGMSLDDIEAWLNDE